jgi:peroxiredoxin Q/BCP
MMQAGSPFPDFSLPNQDGKTVSLSDFAGHWLVVTSIRRMTRHIQAKPSLRRSSTVGIKSLARADDASSHKNFCTSFPSPSICWRTPTPLMKTLGLGQSEWKGMKFWERTTFMVDPKGVIRKVYEKVNPEGHERVLLNDIKALSAAAA